MSIEEKDKIKELLPDNDTIKWFTIWWCRNHNKELWCWYFDRQDKLIFQFSPSYIDQYHVVRLYEVQKYLKENDNK